MKLSSAAALLALSLPAAAGFAPAARTKQVTTSLRMAASGMRQRGSSNWVDYSDFKKSKPSAPGKVRNLPTVVLEPDYYLTWAVALLGPLIMLYHPSYAVDGTPSLIGIAGGGFHILFAALLWVQTRRVRCVFEKDSFTFYNIKGPQLDFEKGAYYEHKPGNYVTQTVNRWRYDKIINYGFFPSLEYPVICYFKETETPKERWNMWFAGFDAYGGGQPHFFPGICNARQFKEQMEMRGVQKKHIKTYKELREEQEQQKE